MKKAFFSRLGFALLTASIFFCVIAAPTHAQSFSTDAGLNNLLSIEINPTAPRANENVTISVQSFRTDLNRADIGWLLNGKLVQTGKGLREFTFTTGKLGTVSTIQVVINPSDGEPFSKTLTLAPADVEIVWQTSTYVPPFYKGKALVGYNAPVTVVALPSFVRSDGTTLDPSSLIYRWSESEDKVYDTQSGYGKNTITLENDTLLPKHIKVEVKSADGIHFAHAEMDIPQNVPHITLYEESPLLGTLFNHSVGTLSLKSDEITLTAIPFFFYSRQKNDSIDYTWRTNNAVLSTNTKHPTLTFRRQSDESGAAAISIYAQSIIKPLEQATNDLMVSFVKN